MNEWEAYVRVAVASAMKAQEDGVARLQRSESELARLVFEVIRQARRATELLLRVSPPAED